MNGVDLGRHEMQPCGSPMHVSWFHPIEAGWFGDVFFLNEKGGQPRFRSLGTKTSNVSWKTLHQVSPWAGRRGLSNSMSGMQLLSLSPGRVMDWGSDRES